jgi:hypothetical protein
VKFFLKRVDGRPNSAYVEVLNWEKHQYENKIIKEH